MKVNSAEIKQKTRISNLLLRPQIKLIELKENSNTVKEILIQYTEGNIENLESIEILLKYEGYILKERELAGKFEKFENITLKENFDYHKLQSLSYEAREKLNKIKPKTIGQAARISGVSPADISVLVVYLGN